MSREVGHGDPCSLGKLTTDLLASQGFSLTEKSKWDFPGCPVAEILCSECRGPRFDPLSGN